jgi:2-polyprenyl-3-methyl-5-hydroxy-6-metoxy-1,4-benzoquinol methylase
MMLLHFAFSKLLMLFILMGLLIYSTVSQFYNISAATWNREYKNGKWEYLEKATIERARNAIIAVFSEMYAPNGTILDVGCGEGILLDHLSRCQRSKYLGIDLSTDAIATAKRKRIEGSVFLVSSADTFQSRTKFDCIIFNEILYYVDHKVIMTKFLHLLNEKGIVIISSFFKRNVNVIKDTIMDDARVIFSSEESANVHGFTKYFSRNKAPVSFHIEVFRRRAT